MIFLPSLKSNAVIASEAWQSSSLKTQSNSGLLRRFAPRNDGQLSLRATQSRGNPVLNFIIIFFLSTAPCQAAISFDGVNDYIQIKNLNLTSGSFCTWINTNAINDGDENRLFSQTSGVTTQGGALGIGISGTGTGTLSEWNGGTWQVLTAANAITANNWTHACVTYLGSNSTVKAYINGIAQVPSPNSNFDFNGVDIALGGNFLLTHGNKWLGSLDDTRIYNRTLTSTEIQTLYNSRSKRLSGSLANGLIAHYEMDDDAIGEVTAQAKDSSGNLNHGQFTGFNNLTTALSNDVPPEISNGLSLKFDGTNTHINIGDLINFEYTSTNSKFSVGFWYKNESPTEVQNLIGKWQETIAAREWVITKDSLDRINLSIADLASGGPANIMSLRTNNAITNGDWLYIFTTSDIGSDVYRIYVNGVLVPSSISGAVTITDMTATAAPLFIGARHSNGVSGPPWEPTNGKLDDIRIYNKALSNSEISFLYNGSGLNPGTSNLQALWTFDDDSALKDSSGNNNHGVGVGEDSLRYSEGVLRR